MPRYQNAGNNQWARKARVGNTQTETLLNAMKEYEKQRTNSRQDRLNEQGIERLLKDPEFLKKVGLLASGVLPEAAVKVLDVDEWKYTERRQLMILAFGKYSGTDIKDVPRDYVEWMIKNQQEKIKEFSDELVRRDQVESANADLTEQIAKVGYRALSMTMHPDKGGSAAKMIELNAAYEQLKMAIKEIKRVTNQTTTA